MFLIEWESLEAFAAYNPEEGGKREEYVIFRANTSLRKHSFRGNVH